MNSSTLFSLLTFLAIGTALKNAKTNEERRKIVEDRLNDIGRGMAFLLRVIITIHLLIFLGKTNVDGNQLDVSKGESGMAFLVDVALFLKEKSIHF